MALKRSDIKKWESTPTKGTADPTDDGNTIKFSTLPGEVPIAPPIWMNEAQRQLYESKLTQQTGTVSNAGTSPPFTASIIQQVFDQMQAEMGLSGAVRGAFTTRLTNIFPTPPNTLQPNPWITGPKDAEWQAIQVERIQNRVTLEFLTVECGCGANTLWLLELPEIPTNTHIPAAGQHAEEMLKSCNKETLTLTCPACDSIEHVQIIADQYAGGVQTRILESWDVRVKVNPKAVIKRDNHEVAHDKW